MSDKWLSDDELENILGDQSKNDGDKEEVTEDILGELLSGDSKESNNDDALGDLLGGDDEKEQLGDDALDDLLGGDDFVESESEVNKEEVKFEEKEEDVIKKEVEAKSVSFEELSETKSSSGNSKLDLDLLYDIPLEIKVLLGSVKKTIGEILEMSEGSIIELEKLAGEPVEVIVGEQIIAKGEIVIIEDNFGVYITEIVSPIERIRTVGNKLRRLKQ